MSRSFIVDAVSEMSRNRSVTHILMSPHTFSMYSNQLTPHHIRSGVKYGTCHGVGIILIEGMSDDLLLTFNSRRAKEARNVLDQARSENYQKAMDLLDELLERDAKWVHVCELPEVEDETT